MPGTEDTVDTRIAPMTEVNWFPTEIHHPDHGRILVVDATKTMGKQWIYAYVRPGEDEGGLIRNVDTEVEIYWEDKPEAADE